jgi:hypothetical protein
MRADERGQPDVRVVPEIDEADYAEFRMLILALPPTYVAWRDYHALALANRGADMRAQLVTIAQFREHMAGRSQEPATIAELFRCAANLAGLTERRARSGRGGRRKSAARPTDSKDK